MRLIDADKLYPDCFTRSGKLAISQSQIAEAPTVEITEEQAIDKLHETGWLPLHDKEMTERPHGKWIDIDSFVNKARCSNCKNIMLTEPYGKTNFCPNCGAEMGKKKIDE